MLFDISFANIANCWQPTKLLRKNLSFYKKFIIKVPFHFNNVYWALKQGLERPTTSAYANSTGQRPQISPSHDTGEDQAQRPNKKRVWPTIGSSTLAKGKGAKTLTECNKNKRFAFLLAIHLTPRTTTAQNLPASGRNNARRSVQTQHAVTLHVTASYTEVCNREWRFYHLLEALYRWQRRSLSPVKAPLATLKDGLLSCKRPCLATQQAMFHGDNHCFQPDKQPFCDLFSSIWTGKKDI